MDRDLGGFLPFHYTRWRTVLLIFLFSAFYRSFAVNNFYSSERVYKICVQGLMVFERPNLAPRNSNFSRQITYC